MHALHFQRKDLSEQYLTQMLNKNAFPKPTRSYSTLLLLLLHAKGYLKLRSSVLYFFVNSKAKRWLILWNTNESNSNPFIGSKTADVFCYLNIKIIMKWINEKKFVFHIFI